MFGSCAGLGFASSNSQENVSFFWIAQIPQLGTRYYWFPSVLFLLILNSTNPCKSSFIWSWPYRSSKCFLDFYTRSTYLCTDFEYSLENKVQREEGLPGRMEIRFRYFYLLRNIFGCIWTVCFSWPQSSLLLL